MKHDNKIQDALQEALEHHSSEEVKKRLQDSGRLVYIPSSILDACQKLHEWDFAGSGEIFFAHENITPRSNVWLFAIWLCDLDSLIQELQNMAKPKLQSAIEMVCDLIVEEARGKKGSPEQYERLRGVIKNLF